MVNLKSVHTARKYGVINLQYIIYNIGICVIKSDAKLTALPWTGKFEEEICGLRNHLAVSRGIFASVRAVGKICAPVLTDVSRKA